MRIAGTSWSRLKQAILFGIVVLLVSSCASTGGKKLVLDTRDVPAVENLPKEVTLMLTDLGYEVVPEPDMERWARQYNDYSMQFKARDADTVRIDVDFRLLEKKTRMRLYNTDEKTPGSATIERYNELKQRVEDTFGADSVR
jgi:hypothetical protein